MDLLVVLIIVLIIVLVWRGPKTLPLLGQALGRGVKEARKEVEDLKSSTTASGPDEAQPGDPGGSPPAS